MATPPVGGRVASSRRIPFPAYRRPFGPQPAYRVGAGARIVAEREYQFTLYAASVTGSGGARYRHLLVVPVTMSAVSYDIGLALVEADSIEADAGRYGDIVRLANAIGMHRDRYRTFPPPPELDRFCL